MKKFYIFITLSLIGLGIGIAAILYGDFLNPSGTAAIPSIKLPFKSFIAGTGIVEAESKNIAVGSAVSGIIRRVWVKSGDRIEKGAPLLELDDTALKAQIMVAKAQIQTAETARDTAKDQLAVVEKLERLSPPLVSKKAYLAARDRYREAEATLALAKAKLDALKAEQKRYTVYSPVKGIVLKAEISAGDYFGNRSDKLLIGSDRFNVRVSINEYDIAKFRPGTAAVAYMRGNTEKSMALRYRYTVPCVVPKTDLTGRSTERTDTRVLQLLYSAPKEAPFPIFVGQQLDVFIQATDEKKR